MVAYYTLMIRLFAALSLLAAFALQAAPAGEAWTRVAALYHQRLQQTGIVGSSLMFVKNGAVAHQAFEGYQDRATRRPVDDDTIYHWASITKTFTGIAIMQLRDRGLLSLDDPVVKFVPELREVHNPFGDISQVTIRHLMTHSAGFRAGTWPWGGDQPWHPFEPTRWAQIVAMMPVHRAAVPAGHAVQLLESRRHLPRPDHRAVLGRRLRGLHRQEHLHAARHGAQLLRPRAVPSGGAPLAQLRRHRRRLTEQRFDFDTGITVSNGGLNAPLGDMAKYLAFLIDGNDTILKRSSLDEMSVPQIRARDGEGGSGDDVQAGLSCFVERHGGVELVGHSGDQNGFISHLYVHRPSRSGYIVSFNTDVSSKRDPRHTTRAVDNDLRDAIIRELFK